jgi:hypothetical protein
MDHLTVLRDQSVRRRRTHLASQTRGRSENHPESPFPNFYNILAVVVNAFCDAPCGDTF